MEKQKRRFGDRKDGRLLRDLDGRTAALESAARSAAQSAARSAAQSAVTTGGETV